MTTKDFEAKIAELGKLRDSLDTYKAITDPLTEQIEQIKFDIIRHMQETKSKRTEPVNGWTVTRVAGRVTRHLRDPQAAAAWLEENDQDLDDFMTIDEKKVIALVLEETRETGELVDFIEATAGQEYLTIKKEETK